MSNETLLQKKRQEYIQQRREDLQQTENYFFQYADMNQRLEQEAKEQITRENLQQRIAAEKAAGLEQKNIPEEELSQEILEKVQAERDAIFEDYQMSSKEQKNAVKDYKVKIKRTKKAQKILDSYNSYYKGMSDMVIKSAREITGSNSFKDNERQNVESAVWLNTLNGGSVISMVDCLLTLSVPVDEEITTQQAERKALEIEKMFKVILDFDINKLKYKNSEDFLKNAAERLMFGAFATDLPHQIDNYRKLVALGKLKDPINPKLINEVEARTNLITTTMTRTQCKLGIMANEKYALTDQDFANEIEDQTLSDKAGEAHRRLDDPTASEEEKKKAERDVAYYNGVSVLKGFDKFTAKTERFKRGDDPNSLLVEYRKLTNQKHPIPADYQEQLDLNSGEREKIRSIEKDGIDHFRASMRLRLDRHGERVNSSVNSAAHTSQDTREFAQRALPKHWEILREKPALRRMMIQKYYGELHRGKKIPENKLAEIEANFESRFEQAKSVDPEKLYASQNEHDSNVAAFLKAHKGEINENRVANAVLYLFRDNEEKEKVKKYNGVAELFKYSSSDAIGTLPADKKERAEKIKDLKEKSRGLVDYVMGFDLKKMEFSKMSDIAPHFEEINHYLQIMTEMQSLPKILYTLGIADDNAFLNMQARVELVMGYSWLFQTFISSHSTVLDALVDPEDMLKVRNAEDWIVFEDDQSQIPDGEEGELIRDKHHYDDLTDACDRSIELAQYFNAQYSLSKAGQTSFYMPGGSMDEALLKCREAAGEKLSSLKTQN
ncbi:MAG: hypothetical protein IJ679_02255, partial [Lachnospiraceae bacterium]|nr:hypothetical protein [Lachnospiraceae bacterium]